MRRAGARISRILEMPAIYELSQKIVGAPRALSRFTAEFVRPFPGAIMLDIGCGPGTMLEYLPDTVRYIGYDANPRYIARARDVYGSRGEFFCARISREFQHPMADRFDIVLAVSILHHLDDKDTTTLVESAYHHLKPKGVLVTLDPVYISDQSVLARYIISKDRGRYVRKPEEYIRLTSDQQFSVETRILAGMLRIPYTHILMRCRKK